LHGFSWNLDKHALVSFSKTSNSTRSSFGKAGERGGQEGGEIPRARGAQRGPEISVKCLYIVYHRQFPEGQGPVFTNRHFVPGPVVGSRRPCPSDSCYFEVFEKLTCACYIQIALKTMLLPIFILYYIYIDDSL
jgi:hypothetical protein